MKLLTILLVMIFIPGCENVDMDMYHQISFKPQEAPRRSNPARSVPAFGTRLDYSDIDGTTLESPFSLDDSAAGRGKDLYETFCAICHGQDGISDTKVAQKMDVMPFDLAEESVMELTDGEIFVKILASDTVMSKYRNELTDKEAWEITAYVRSLQKEK